MKMKKLIAAAIIFFTPFVLHAQDIQFGDRIQIKDEYVRNVAIKIIFYWGNGFVNNKVAFHNHNITKRYHKMILETAIEKYH